MAADSREFVAVVLDPDFGEELYRVAESVDVWVTPSPSNRSAVVEYWRRSTNDKPKTITMWSTALSGATVDEWLGILDDIELHHGELSGPGVAGLEVYGAVVTPHAQAALDEYGYRVVEVRSDGFRAVR
jgi:hypothetical protein